MTRFSEHDVAERLASVETPEPPDELLERLLADIPDHLPGEGDMPPAVAPPSRSPSWWSPRWLAAAAALLMVVGGGFLALRVQQRMGSAPLAETAADRGTERSSESPAAATAPPPRATEQAAAGQVSTEATDRLAKTEAAAPPPAPEPPAPPQVIPRQVSPVLVIPKPSAAGADAGARDDEASSLGPRSRSGSYPIEPDAARRQAAGANGQFSVGFQAVQIDRIAGPEPPIEADGSTTTAGESGGTQSKPSPIADFDGLERKKLRESERYPAPARKVAPPSAEPAPAADKPKAAAPPPPPSAPAQVDAEYRRLEEPAELRENLEVSRGEDEDLVFDVPAIPPVQPPSTGGTTEPNGQAYGDVFFDPAGTNPFVDVEDDPYSTFALDVDTASYTVVRRYLRDGHLPPTSAVRVEEMVNYFSYGDAPPRRGDFALTAEGGPAIFAQTSRYRLLRFHLQARRLAPAERRPSVMMLVVDVSGSMQWENRLDTVRRSLAMLVDHLEPGDRIGLISFGATARLLVEPTADHDRLRSAIERLVTDGSTNAEAGLVMAYETLARYRQPGTTRRVILCSDGVANVGETDAERILERVHREAEGGIELTTVGFGMGNYNDALMEKLADQGDGRYAYVDDLREARRVFVEELTGTLETVASDARVQVEFDRQHVERYRLLGYENRDMKDELFRDDTADAGEIGSGHGVTALYEVKLERGVERLGAAHLATLRLRYRSTASGHFEEQEIPIDLEDLAPTWQDTSRALRLSTLVAEFAEILRGSYWAKGGDLHEVFRRAQQVSAEYPGDVRVAEFAALVGRAAELVDAGKKPGE